MSDPWLAATAPDPLFALLRPFGVSRRRGGARKWRLVGCAAARLVWDRVPDAPFRRAVGIAEQFADAELRRVDLAAAGTAAQPRRPTSPFAALVEPFQPILSVFGIASPDWTLRTATGELVRQLTARQVGWVRAAAACRTAVQVAVTVGGETERAVTEAALADRVRDLFGRPGEAVVIDPGWRTRAVVGLARTAHAGAFDRLPILADALEEAGCDHAELLAHCRGSGPHARGCWAVDAVLGRHVW